MITDVQLSAVGPFSWVGAPNLFTSEAGRHAGIYLWTMDTDHGELVGYVGETERSFAERMAEHLAAYLAGDSNLYDPDSLRHGEGTLVWKGLGYDNSESRHAEFQARTPELLPLLRYEIEHTRFWLLPCDLEKRARCRIEGAIAHHLYDQPKPVGTFQEKLTYQRRDESERVIHVTFEGADHLVGFPTSLEA